jgi:hypothetical protein
MIETCPFCKNPGEKVDAHIIPKAFFEDIANDGNVLKQRALDNHAKRVPIGIYDDQIWCKSCEVKYGKWDDFAIAILRTPIEEFSKLNNAYELQIDNLDKLRLFFISLIWRASTSKHVFFDQVSLGGLADLAKTLLVSSSPGSIENFSTIITYSGDDDCLIANPLDVRYSDVLFYRFYLGRFVAEIKVDSKPTPGALLPVVIGRKKHLVILHAPRDERLVDSTSKIAKQQLK